MSGEHFSDVLGSTEPPLASIIDTYGLPPEEGAQAPCQTPPGIVLEDKLGLGERPQLVAPETEQAGADRAVAYGKVMTTTEGTLEYDQALEAFILLLFPDCSPPGTLPTEAQSLEAPPSHAV